MATLLLRLAGPMQSWGTQSRFRDRDTGLEPSKSGVAGILCAALGRGRAESVDDLAALRMGVRIDDPGTLDVDYHTVNYPQFNREGEVIGRQKEAIISHRYYLSGARFLVGLEGDEGVLQTLDAALMRPRWQLFLGRKSFPPSEPIRLPDGLRAEGLEDALRGYPVDNAPADRLRLVLDADPGEGSEIRNDVPISFSQRQYAERAVRSEWMEVPR